jgi:hypothetical protein
MNQSTFLTQSSWRGQANERAARPSCRWTFCKHATLLEYRQEGVRLELAEKLVSRQIASITRLLRSAMLQHWRPFDLPAAMLVTIGALAILTGCGPSSDRLAVSGEVTLDGAPLDQGAIRLTSMGTEKLRATGGMIQNGEFHIPQEKGLPPGTYLVEISAPNLSVPPVVYKGAPGEPALPPTAPERIPPEYNVNSTKTVDVSADSDNHFVFEIASRPGK